MIESVTFKNFRVLQDTILPLGPFTLIVGPNGSGKSTAILAIPQILSGRNAAKDIITAGLDPMQDDSSITVKWENPFHGLTSRMVWHKSNPSLTHTAFENTAVTSEMQNRLLKKLKEISVFSFDAQALAAPVPLRPNAVLQPNGGNLAGVLDRLRDHQRERFDALERELIQWIPEFDQIVFDTPSDGVRSISLRMREGKHAIKASDLSQGTLLALAILTLSYLPETASFVCIEEPDRGIHPRLLRHVRDALNRLAYPADYGEKRNPVQVVVTTHSPYLLDLYKDEPEIIVIAQKGDQGTTFQRLSDLPNVEEILRDGHLGDVWYSGILGGVPARS